MSSKRKTLEAQKRDCQKALESCRVIAQISPGTDINEFERRTQEKIDRIDRDLEAKEHGLPAKAVGKADDDSKSLPNSATRAFPEQNAEGNKRRRCNEDSISDEDSAESGNPDKPAVIDSAAKNKLEIDTARKYGATSFDSNMPGHTPEITIQETNQPRNGHDEDNQREGAHASVAPGGQASDGKDLEGSDRDFSENGCSDLETEPTDKNRSVQSTEVTSHEGNEDGTIYSCDSDDDDEVD